MEHKMDFVKGCVTGLIVVLILAVSIYALPEKRIIDALRVDAKVILVGKNVELKGKNGSKPELFDYYGTLYLPAASIGSISGKTVNWDAKKYVLNLGKTPAQPKAPAVNKKGNTCANIANGGFVAQQGDWIYFNQYQTYNDKLYKMKLDGSGKKLLYNGSVGYINVVGDWIYYTCGGIYKMKTDGSGRKKLCGDNAAELAVEGGWMYYRNQNDGFLYKVKTDGKSRTKLCGRAVKYLNLSEGWLYYCDEKGIWKMKTDGKGEVMVYSGSACYLNVSGGWIYFTNEERNMSQLSPKPVRVMKIRLDGTEFTVIDELDSTRNINVSGDWIYTMDAFGIRMKTDGTKRELLGLPSNADIGICTAGDWLFFLESYGSMGDLLCRMRNDGSGMERMGVPESF